MGELISRLSEKLRFPKTPKKENLLYSNFVMIGQDGFETRLQVGDKDMLVSSVDQTNKRNRVRGFRIAAPDRLTLRTYRDNGFFNSDWGQITGIHNGNQGFGVTISDRELMHHGGRTYIKNTGVYFEENLTRLQGKGWTLEYRPK